MWQRGRETVGSAIKESFSERYPVLGVVAIDGDAGEGVIGCERSVAEWAACFSGELWPSLWRVVR